VGDVVDRISVIGAKAVDAKQELHDKLSEHKQFIVKFGKDMPEVATGAGPIRIDPAG